MANHVISTSEGCNADASFFLDVMQTGFFAGLLRAGGKPELGEEAEMLLPELTRFIEDHRDSLLELALRVRVECSHSPVDHPSYLTTFDRRMSCEMPEKYRELRESVTPGIVVRNNVTARFVVALLAVMLLGALPPQTETELASPSVPAQVAPPIAPEDAGFPLLDPVLEAAAIETQFAVLRIGEFDPTHPAVIATDAAFDRVRQGADPDEIMRELASKIDVLAKRDAHG